MSRQAQSNGATGAEMWLSQLVSCMRAPRAGISHTQRLPRQPSTGAAGPNTVDVYLHLPSVLAASDATAGLCGETKPTRSRCVPPRTMGHARHRSTYTSLVTPMRQRNKMQKLYRTMYCLGISERKASWQAGCQLPNWPLKPQRNCHHEWSDRWRWSWVVPHQSDCAPRPISGAGELHWGTRDHHRLASCSR